MSNNRMHSVLVALLFISVASSACLAYWHIQLTRQLPSLQMKRIIIGQRLNRFQELVNETAEYSRKNPDIQPLLRSYEPKTNAPAAPPASKPAK